MTKDRRPTETSHPARGVLVEAENGPAIEFDETGIILHLADRVIEDVARRLPKRATEHAQSFGQQSAFEPSAVEQSLAGQPSAAFPQADLPLSDQDHINPTQFDQTARRQEAAHSSGGNLNLSAPTSHLDASLLGDIDAWDLRQDGDFYRFTAHLSGAESGPRSYLRALSGGAILAEAGGALQAILGLGGGRFCTTWPDGPAFPHHVLGVDLPDEGETPQLATRLRNRSGESLLADALLDQRQAARRSMPLMPLVKVLAPPGHDPRPSVEALLVGFDRCRALAKALDRPTRVQAVRLDLGFDQAPRQPEPFHGMIRDLLDQLAEGLAERDAGAYPILLCPDAGAWWQDEAAETRPVFEALHQLVLRPGAHRIVIPSPGYAFAQDALGQPTEAAMQSRSELEAAALTALQNGQEWLCPLLCLAERSGQTIRATFRATADLVLDPADPFGAGASAGFALRGTDAKIASAEIAADDPQSVLLQISGALAPNSSGLPLALDLGFGGTDANPAPFTPRASSALRDTWEGASRNGHSLRRWALPASVAVH